MKALRRFLVRLAAFITRRRDERRLREEVEEHLALQTEANINAGLSPQEARRQAVLKFGGPEAQKEHYRDQLSLPSLEQFLQDVRFALRSLRRSPGFTAVGVITLALAIGGNTTIFTLINVLTLRALPVEHPEQLVGISAVATDGSPATLSPATLQELKRHQQSFSDLIGWDGNGVVSVENENGITLANFWAVTGNFYAMLGEAPHVGRLLSIQDEEPAAQVVVVGYDFWQRWLGGDPDVIGRQIRIESASFTIVGVTRPWFTGLWVGGSPEVTVPLSTRGLIFRGPGNWATANLQTPIFVTGRLKRGIEIDQARAEIQTLWRGVREATLPATYTGARRDAFLAAAPAVESIATGHEMFLRPRFTRTLYVLMGIAGLLLVIACVHLASLQMARTARRNGELSVRVALGAAPTRLVAQVLTECLLLTIAGASVGLALGVWGSSLLADFMSQQFLTSPNYDVSPDMTVVGLTLAVIVVAVALTGTASAWFAARRDPMDALRRNSRSLMPSTIIGSQSIIVQVALTLVLVAVAGLLTRSVGNAHAVDAGFDPVGLLQAQLIRRPGVPADEPPDYARQLIERIVAIPGVDAASLSGDRTGRGNAVLETILFPSGEQTMAGHALVGPGYFRTIGTRLIGGRDFAWGENSGVAVVSRSLAQRMFPHGDAIGGTVRIGASEHVIVGVVEDARREDVRKAPGMAVYTPLLRQRQTSYLHVRTNVDSEALRREVARHVDALRRQYVLRTHTTTEIIDQALVEVRLARVVAQAFAIVGLLLVCIGLYGVMAYRAAARTPEIGIRMALGADARTVLTRSLREAVLLIGGGIGLGLPLALVSTTALRSLLFGLEPNDPLTLLVTTMSLVVVGLLAAYLPARRAARVDPLVALRYE